MNAHGLMARTTWHFLLAATKGIRRIEAEEFGNDVAAKLACPNRVVQIQS